MSTISLRGRLAVLAALAAPAVSAQSPPPDVVWERTVGDRAYSVAFSPNGLHVATGADRADNFSLGRVDVFAAADGAPLGHADAHPASTNGLGVTNEVAFSPDGARLASAHGAVICQPIGGCSPVGSGLYTWSAPALGPLAGLALGPVATSAAYAADGSALAAGFAFDPAGAVRLYDPATLALEQALPGPSGETTAVRYSPDGTAFASVGTDGLLRVWDTATGAPRFAVQHGTYTDGGRPVSVAFSADGQFVATGGDGYRLRVRVWRADTGALVQSLDARIQAAPDYGGRAVVAFTPNGAYVAAGVLQLTGAPEYRRTVVRFWSVATGALAGDVVEDVDGPNGGGVSAVAFSPGQDRLFAYTIEGRVKAVRTALSLAGATASDPGAPGGSFTLAVGPNPARASASVSVTLAESQAVRVEAFDALGRRVAVVHDGPLGAGAHRLGLDVRGLPAGVYVVRATGAGVAASRTVTVVR